jgi:hypothetical protein
MADNENYPSLQQTTTEWLACTVFVRQLSGYQNLCREFGQHFDAKNYLIHKDAWWHIIARKWDGQGFDTITRLCTYWVSIVASMWRIWWKNFYAKPLNMLGQVWKGRDSSVGIAFRYGLDGPGIESRWVSRFSAPVQTGLGAHPACYTMGTRCFPGVNRSGRGLDHPPPSSAEVKERVELYLYSPMGLRGLF